MRERVIWLQRNEVAEPRSLPRGRRTPGAKVDAGRSDLTVARSTLRLEGVADERQTGTGVTERVAPKTTEPIFYGVVLLNDDYTPMQFVTDILETLFQKSPAEAYRIMMQVHLNGRGLAGTYPYEVAETKVESLVSRARAAGFPLQATIVDV